MVAGRDPVHLPFPWIDGLTKRQQEEIYLDFQALAGQGGTRWRTIVIAASNSTAKSKGAADYVCQGTADQVTIQRAVDLLSAQASSANLGRIVLLEGTYNLTAEITVSALTTRVLAIEGMAGNAQGTSSVTGTRLNSSTAPIFTSNGVGGDPSGTLIIENIGMRASGANPVISSRDVTLHVRNCMIENTTASGNGISQSNSTGGSSNTIIEGNRITVGANATGIGAVTGPTLGYVSRISHNSVTIGANGVGIGTGNDINSSPSYHVNDNTIYGTGSGNGAVGIQCSGTSTQNNVVVDNHVKNCGVGIRVAGYKNIIATNLVEACDYGFQDGAFQLDASFIVGNNFIDCVSVGIRVGNTSATKNGILGNKVVGYATTTPIACAIGGSAIQTHVYYNDFDSGVTTPIVDSGSGTSTTFGVPAGGTTGQLLAKVSNASGDVAWQTDYVKAAITAAGDLIVGLASGSFQALHKIDTLGTQALPWSSPILVQTTEAPGVRWGPTLTVGTVAPTSPREGDIWMDTT